MTLNYKDPIKTSDNVIENDKAQKNDNDAEWNEDDAVRNDDDAVEIDDDAEHKKRRNGEWR